MGECCESCASSPGANCTHWTWDGTECTQWSGGNCKQYSAVGATSAKIENAGPSPSPPSPGSMPVYHQMLWDADLYVGRLVDAVKARGMWDNAVIFYSADNGTSHVAPRRALCRPLLTTVPRTGGTGDGINWPLRGTKHTKYGIQLTIMLLMCLPLLTVAAVAVDDANDAFVAHINARFGGDQLGGRNACVVQRCTPHSFIVYRCRCA